VEVLTSQGAGQLTFTNAISVASAILPCAQDAIIHIIMLLGFLFDAQDHD
jgi:hypothetical protein